MTKVAAELDRIGSHVEAARERLVLALITGRTAGKADAVQWELRMRECGFVSPMNEVYACYPELQDFT